VEPKEEEEEEEEFRRENSMDHLERNTSNKGEHQNSLLINKEKCYRVDPQGILPRMLYRMVGIFRLCTVFEFVSK